ncbi:MAG TPA: hypothetical protein DCR27_05275 [Lachnospiraceae bacterium]|nr:hypothetical protein [Lachnospiraceae bacterium]
MIRLYRIAICDDDRRFADGFHKKVNKALAMKNIDAETEEFYDTASFLGRINNGIVFDLIFLDILLDGENGYSFARQIRRENIPIDIVFITVTQEYAVVGYDVAPILYLVKPIEDTQLHYSFDLFLKRHVPSQVLLNLPGGILSLDIADILYCEVYGHKACFHLASGESRELRCSLNRLEHQLPSSVFARSHQSYLINMEHIDSITRYELTLSTGQTLPISQSRYLELQNSFLLYASQQKIRI